jgi:hypothetical protein
VEVHFSKLQQGEDSISELKDKIKLKEKKRITFSQRTQEL